jgi:type IV secretory pathway TraG/TraD family ATPase VirD4
MSGARAYIAVALLFVVALAVSVTFGLLFGWLISDIYRYGSDILTGLTQGGMNLYSDLLSSLPYDLASLSRFVTDVDLANETVFVVTVITTAACFLVLFRPMRTVRSVRRAVLGVEGPASERFATNREAAKLKDHVHLVNNILLTKHCGIRLTSWTKRQAAYLFGISLNIATVGSSGRGKTFSVSMVEILQALGGYLLPLRTGIMALPPFAAIAAIKEHVDARRGIWPSFKVADSPRFKGFDLFNTDPKGENIRKVGWAFRLAGFIVKCFNTIDLSPDHGLRYNPFDSRYIHERTTAVAEAKEIECHIVATAAGKKRKTSPDMPLKAYARCGQAGIDWSSIGGVPAQLNVTLDLVTTHQAADTASGKGEQWYKDILDASVDQSTDNFTDKREFSQRKMLCSYSYKHTEGTIQLCYRNLGHDIPPDTTVAIRLDKALVFDGFLKSDMDKEVYRAARYDLIHHAVIWNISQLSVPKEDIATFSDADAAIKVPTAVLNEIAPDDHQALEVLAQRLATSESEDLEGCVFSLTIPVSIREMSIADGVDLPKTVDCLVRNIRNADAEPGGDQAFWEDTKRLFFTHIIALLFERFEPCERNFRNMMKLIDMCLSDDPVKPSPMKVMMDAWEYGRIYEDTAGDGDEASPRERTAKSGRWVPTSEGPHPRSVSLALHAYHAWADGAEDTVRSVLITVNAALSAMLSADILEMTSFDEMELDTLGNANQRQVIFLVKSATDATYDFLTALMFAQTTNLLCEKAYRNGGKLDRHVRFELDEFKQLGRVSGFDRTIAYVRSLNMSIHFFIQSRHQLVQVYGEEGAKVIMDNVAATVFLGAQDATTNEEMSQSMGDKTVFYKTFSKNYSESATAGGSTTESEQATTTRLRTAAEVRRQKMERIFVLLAGQRPILDKRYPTRRHPLYAYIDPEGKRYLTEPVARFRQEFEYPEYVETYRKSRKVT